MRNMKAWRLIKPRIVVMAFPVLLVACCILRMNSSKPTWGIDGPLHLNNRFNSENNKLFQVLRRASMGDRMVILTVIFDKEWTKPGSVLDLFLESFRLGQGTKRFLNHLVIVTLGNQAFQNCNALHPHCFQLGPVGSKKGPLVLEYLRLQRKTNNLLLEVLELGYNFIFTEADVMWLRTPIADIHPQYEITIPWDFFSYDSRNRSNKPGRGLFHVKSNALSVEIFKYWKVLGVLYPNYHVESLCEVLKDQKEEMEMLEVNIKYLDTTYFGGFCEGGSREISKVYTLQANCRDNTEDKVNDLRLVLEDWKKFRAHNHSIPV